ncbi:hypothetical protein OG809_13040 [Kribbella soli]
MDDGLRVRQHIRAALDEVVRLMDEALAEVGYRPQSGSSLDQVFLLDGAGVVNDYIEHGELGLALDHLLYMVEEPPLLISRSTFEHIEAASVVLGVQPARLDNIRARFARPS